MKDIKIGNIIITKKGILRSAFILFIIGMLVGGQFAMAEDGKSKSIIMLSFIFLIPIFYLIPGLKKEIIRVKN